MVRKAVSLKSINELELTKRTRAYLSSKFNSVEGLIWYGRAMAYSYTCNPGNIKRGNKSTLELINALDLAGFIRHDITPRSFAIGRLYRMVFYDKVDAIAAPVSVNDFCETAERISSSETVYHVDYRIGNEKYESFENPKELNTVNLSLKACLPERDYEVFAYRMGFTDGIAHTMEQTARYFGVTCERVRQIESRVVRSLRRNSMLPTIFQSSDEQRAEVVAIIREIEAIRKDPIYKREAELLQRLRDISKMPFDCAAEVAKYIDGEISNFSGIDKLGLSVRAYNCLKRAGIDSIEDIIKYPKEDWPNVQNLGRKATREVEEKVRMAGYVGFSTGILS